MTEILLHITKEARQEMTNFCHPKSCLVTTAMRLQFPNGTGFSSGSSYTRMDGNTYFFGKTLIQQEKYRHQVYKACELPIEKFEPFDIPLIEY